MTFTARIPCSCAAFGNSCGWGCGCGNWGCGSNCGGCGCGNCGCGSNCGGCGCIRPLSILSPLSGQVIDVLGAITGTGTPCAELSVTIDSNPEIHTIVGPHGYFRVDNPYLLEPGPHTVCVREPTVGGWIIEPVCVTFTVIGLLD